MRNKPFGARGLPALGLLFFAALPASGDSFNCPKEVNTRQELSAPLEGWQTNLSGKSASLLRSVDFFEIRAKGAKTASISQLAPDNADSGKDPVWTLDPAEEYWLGCNYSNTNIVLSRDIGRGFKRCEVKFNKHVSPQVDSIRCDR
jgi:hypothetical protein